MENKAVILNKYDSIERCIKRINEEYAGNIDNLNNYSKCDAIVLNLQRACELAKKKHLKFYKKIIIFLKKLVKK